MNECEIGNGFRLYWKDNGVGGRIFYSDEIGNGVVVWDTCCVDSITLLAALHKEHELLHLEAIQKEKGL